MASLLYTPPDLPLAVMFPSSLERAVLTLTASLLFPGFPQKLDAGNQLALIEELHKEIRFIGNESKGEHVPGFCLPKKVSQGSGAGCRGHAAFLNLPPQAQVCWGAGSSCVSV